MQKTGKYQHPWLNLYNISYVDDIAHITDSQEHLQTIVTKLKEDSEKASLEMNVKRQRLC